MNRLQLCQKLRQEVRISGTGPTTTLNQLGEYLKVVDWIDLAYEDIQRHNVYWQFLQAPFSFALTVGKRDYTPTEAGIPLLSDWKDKSYGDIRCYLTVSDEQRLHYIDWDTFRDTYLIGNQRTATGRPRHFSIEPDKTINFDLIPDQIYTVNGEYFKKPAVMAADADEPLFPSQFHMAIVYRAMMFYGADYAANEKYTHGQNEFNRILRKLEHEYLPTYTWGPPLV